MRTPDHRPAAVADTEELRPLPAATPPRARRWPVLELLVGLVVLVAVFRDRIAALVDGPALQTWALVFVSVVLQALPFLMLGVLVSGAIAALLPAGWLARALPRRPVLAVPSAGLAGALLPGCECGSVPIAGRLVARGVLPAAAMAFLLAAPAINPVVLVSTAVAFPGQPRIVLARFLASFGVAVIMGLAWSRFGNEALIERARRRIVPGASRWATFVGTVRHDFLHAGGYLVVGGLAAGTLKVAVPASWLDALAGSGPTAVVALGLLAFVLAICSEADAFVAASLTQFSATARLAFMVVGPAVDVKLVALQAGVFGRGFAIRFAPATFAVALIAAGIVGRWLL